MISINYFFISTNSTLLFFPRLTDELLGFIGIVWSVVAIAMILIILVQKGKGGGLGGAFGGAGGGGGLLGTKTGDFLTWVTIGLVFFFFFLAILLVKFGNPADADDLRATVQSAPAGNTTGTDALGTDDADATADTDADTGNTDAPVAPEDADEKTE